MLFSAAKNEELLIVSSEKSHRGTLIFNIIFLQEKQNPYETEYPIKAALKIASVYDEARPVTSILVKVEPPEKAINHELYFVDARRIVSQVAYDLGVLCTDRNKGIFEFPPAKFFEDIEDNFVNFMDIVARKIDEAPRSCRTALPGSLPAAQAELPFTRKFD